MHSALPPVLALLSRTVSARQRKAKARACDGAPLILAGRNPSHDAAAHLPGSRYSAPGVRPSGPTASAPGVPFWRAPADAPWCAGHRVRSTRSREASGRALQHPLLPAPSPAACRYDFDPLSRARLKKRKKAPSSRSGSRSQRPAVLTFASRPPRVSGAPAAARFRRTSPLPPPTSAAARVHPSPFARREGEKARARSTSPLQERFASSCARGVLPFRRRHACPVLRACILPVFFGMPNPIHITHDLR